MPIPVYSIQVRGRDMNGSHRCTTKEEAQGIYDKLTEAVNSPNEFFELELSGQKVTARKANVSGFVLAVHMEETPEERKQRAIEQIERQGGYENACVEKGYAQNALIGGGGLI